VLILVFFVHRVTPIVPALALAKALRLGAPVTTRRCSSRPSQAVVSAAATGESSRDAAMATRPQQEETAAAAVASASPALHSAGARAAVVDVADDDAPLPGWGQWRNQPTSAPEPALKGLVMREDGCVMSHRPAHGTEASTSRAAPPASDVAVVQPGQRLGRAGTT
jgi:hypothetical protein